MKYNNLIVVFIFISTLLVAIEPVKTYTAQSIVTDIEVSDSKLFIATDNGRIEVFNIASTKLINTIKFPFIKDFTGSNIAPKVYDIDIFNNVIIAVLQGKHGFSNVFINVKNENSQIIIDIENKLMIKKVKFINSNLILLGLLSNEIILYNISEKKIVYQKQISNYTFSDFAISNCKKRIATADESGIIHILNTKTGKVIKNVKGVNIDKVYQTDYKGNTIICGGQDRRLSVYKTNTKKSYYIMSSFLVYSVGLSPSGKIGGYAANEENEIKIIDINKKKIIKTLTKHSSIITKILFVDEDKLFTSADEKKVYYWTL